ncbi:MAG: hypothetical protein C0482_02335 [Gordonia sp.]|nr:hypothetical protein [Gordonia sp. (in: high G+C Gram-positive bacteria)]
MSTENGLLPRDGERGASGTNWYRPGIAVAGSVAVLGALLVWPGSAGAAPLPAECVQAGSAGVVTCTYSTGTHALTLPEGVATVTVTAIGGRGGSYIEGDNRYYSGGIGAVVNGTVAVPAGSRTLHPVVAGDGGDTRVGPDDSPGVGGFNGGGTAGIPKWPGRKDYAPGAGGGGASDIRTDPTDLDSRVLIAAGGGGGSYYGNGGNADFPSPSEWGGNAGTQTAGGAGGRSENIPGDGLPGRLGVGGTGGSVADFPVAQSILSGAGGGGGLYGGGGGSLGHSGGGGSSLLSDGYHGATLEGPSITITYRPPGSPCTGSVCIGPGLFGSS